MRLERGVAVVWLAVLVVGCSTELEQQKQAAESAKQLTVRQEVAASAQQRDLGEDCRAARCRGGAPCIHSGVPPRDRYVCSAKCASDDDCPVDWRCMRDEALGAAYCVAPTGRPGWNFDAVVARASRTVDAGWINSPPPPQRRLDGGAP